MLDPPGVPHSHTYRGHGDLIHSPEGPKRGIEARSAEVARTALPEHQARACSSTRRLRLGSFLGPSTTDEAREDTQHSGMGNEYAQQSNFRRIQGRGSSASIIGVAEHVHVGLRACNSYCAALREVVPDTTICANPAHHTATYVAEMRVLLCVLIRIAGTVVSRPIMDMRRGMRCWAKQCRSPVPWNGNQPHSMHERRQQAG